MYNRRQIMHMVYGQTKPFAPPTPDTRYGGCPNMQKACDLVEYLQRNHPPWHKIIEGHQEHEIKLSDCIVTHVPVKRGDHCTR